MPRYPYLNDDTPFDASSLNTRFDTLSLALNTLNPDAIAERALNPVHIPSLVGNVVTAETPSARVDTPGHVGSPIGVIGSFASTTLDSPQLPFSSGYYVTLSDALTLTRSSLTPDVPTALMVFANAEVKDFEGIELIESYGAVYGITLNEYTWDATVVLVCESSTGTRSTLYRTARQVSPRVTIGSFRNMESDEANRIPMGPLRDMPGNRTGGPSVFQFDHKTYQDVAIRTVITATDLTEMGLADIKTIHLGFLSGNKRDYRVQRANITALPLVAEVL